MSSSSLTTGLRLLVLLAPLALAGCSAFRPVYGDAGTGAEQLRLNYAEPRGRLEQIIVQDLILRIGSTEAAGMPVFSVEAESSKRQLTSTNVVKPATQWEVTVVAKYEIAVDDRVVSRGSRRASANYTTNGQVLADEAALKDATERAGHAVAETIRLSILGALSQTVR